VERKNTAPRERINTRDLANTGSIIQRKLFRDYSARLSGAGSTLLIPHNSFSRGSISQV
jgi:hypothetical protein